MTSSSDKYCFLNPPEDIENEISSIGQENIFLKDPVEDCPDESIKVCFSGNCDIEIIYNEAVDYDSESHGSVKKNGLMHFRGDALMYAAIFSADKKTYECQVKRLIKRTSQLADLYQRKTGFIFQQHHL